MIFLIFGFSFFVLGIFFKITSVSNWGRALNLADDDEYKTNLLKEWFLNRNSKKYQRMHKYSKQCTNPQLQLAAKKASKFDTLFIVSVMIGILFLGIGGNI